MPDGLPAIDLCVWRSSAEPVMAARGFPEESLPNGAWSGTADHKRHGTGQKDPDTNGSYQFMSTRQDRNVLTGSTKSCQRDWLVILTWAYLLCQTHHWCLSVHLACGVTVYSQIKPWRRYNYMHIKVCMTVCSVSSSDSFLYFPFWNILSIDPLNLLKLGDFTTSECRGSTLNTLVTFIFFHRTNLSRA